MTGIFTEKNSKIWRKTISLLITGWNKGYSHFFIQKNADHTIPGCEKILLKQFHIAKNASQRVIGQFFV